MSSLSPGASIAAPPFRFTLACAAVTCALLPAYTIRWHISFYPSTILEDAILVTAAVFAFESWRARLLPTWRTTFTLPAAIFLVAGLISVLDAPDRRAALGIYRAYLIEPVLFFFVMANLVTAVRRALWIVAGLGVAGTVVAVVNIVAILDTVRHHKLDVAGNGTVAIFMNANDIPMFLVPLIAIAGSIVLYSADRTERVVSAVFMVIALAAVVLSFSRGGYLALAAVAVGLAVSHPRRWWLLAAAVAAAIVLVLIPPINHRIAIELDFSNSSNTLVGRFGLWSATLQMLQGHFLLGAGLSGFATALAPIWSPSHSDTYIYPHNIFLTFWSETGLLGLASFAWIAVVGFMRSWRGWKVGVGVWRPIGLGALLMLVDFVVHGQVDVPYFKNDLSLEFWIIIGLAWAASTWGAGERPSGTSAPKRAESEAR